MRKIFNILLLLLLSNYVIAQQNIGSVTVSYKCLNKPLPVVLRELSKISGVNIVFSDSKLYNRKTVTVSAEDENLVEVINVILKPYRYTTEIIGNNLVVVNERFEELKKEFTISGYVKSRSDGEVLPYANIFLSDRSIGVNANEKGFYSLKILRGSYTLMSSYVGFTDDSLSLFLKRDTTINFNLRDEVLLQEVTIAENFTKSSIKYGEDYFSKDRIGTSLMLGGESDILRSINNVAGVSSAADGFGGISVRGGNYDQNLILYDGVPILNTGHAFGLISIFNSNAVQDARLIKGGIPARYSGRLSSVIDIKTIDGNNKRYEGEISISTLASKASLQGPIVKDKASFIVSYRRTFADIFINELTDFINKSSNTVGKSAYYFDDINAKINFKLAKNHTFNVSYYGGGDNLINEKKFSHISSNITYSDVNNFHQEWGNGLISLHLNSQLSNNLFSKLSAFSSNWKSTAYTFKRYAIDSLSFPRDIYNADFKESNLTTKGLKWDLDYVANKSNFLRIGLGYNKYISAPKFRNLSNLNYLDIYPDVLTEDQLLSNIKFHSNKNNELNAYIEDEITVGKGALLNIGLHYSRYSFAEKSTNSIQPRLNFNIKNDRSWLNVGSSFIRQYFQIISENGLGFPSDLWVNATEFIKPADGINNSITFGFLLGKNASLNFSGYYKTMKNIVALGEGQGLTLTSDSSWQKSIPRGEGKSYGAEATLNIETKFLNLDINYTYGKSTRTFEDLNNGEEFFYKNDRPFMLNCYSGIKLGSRTEISMFFTYQAGNSISLPTGGIIEKHLNGKKYLYPIFEGKNNFRFDDMVRMDVGFTFKAKNQIGFHKIYVGIYNVLNKKNPFYIEISRNNFNLDVYEVNKISIFPLFPSFSYTYIFGKK